MICHGVGRRRVPSTRESAESTPVEPHSQRIIACNESIHANVKFSTSDEVRIRYVPLNNVRLGIVVLSVVPAVALPFGNLLQVLKEEDPLSLGPSDRLHDPQARGVPLEFFDKEGVVSREDIRKGPEIERLSLATVAFLLELPFVPFQILDHQIFSAEFALVSKVVHPLPRAEVNLIENFTHPLSLSPMKVPIVTFCLLPSSPQQSFVNCIPKRCLERQGLARRPYFSIIHCEGEGVGSVLQGP